MPKPKFNNCRIATFRLHLFWRQRGLFLGCRRSPGQKLSTGSPQRDSEFTYDGFGRRVKIVEKANDSVTSTKQFVWVGTRIAEERDGANAVTKRFYAEGQINYQPSTINLFYTRDHLGSVREVTDNSGNVVARYDYDPYGRVTKVSGSVDSNFLYTGHYYHAPSGLHLAMYRAYDSESGRWLNRDPIGEAGGINLYGYVASDPINASDPLGLDRNSPPSLTVGSFPVAPLTRPTPVPWIGPSLQGPLSFEKAEQGAILGPLGTVVGVADLVNSGIEYGAGQTTLGSNGRFYANGWGGNKAVCTVGLSRAAAAAGPWFFGAGIMIDGVNYANGDPNTSLEKAGVNAGFGAVGLLGGPIGTTIGATYFLTDSFYPGGWSNALTWYGNHIEEGRKYDPMFHLRLP